MPPYHMKPAVKFTVRGNQCGQGYDDYITVQSFLWRSVQISELVSIWIHLCSWTVFEWSGVCEVCKACGHASEQHICTVGDQATASMDGHQ